MSENFVTGGSGGQRPPPDKAPAKAPSKKPDPKKFKPKK